MRDKGNLIVLQGRKGRNVDDRTFDLFGEQVRAEHTTRIPDSGSSLDGLLSKTHVEADAPINDTVNYNITLDSLNPFFLKVSRKKPSETKGENKKNYIVSHVDHFNAVQHAYNGIFAMESHIKGEFTGRYGIPHEHLIHSMPSEILAYYISAGELKCMGNDEYHGLLQRSFEEVVMELRSKAKMYKAIRRMEKKEDGASTTLIPSLSWRLSRVSKEGREEFMRAFRQPLNPVRPIYREQPAPRENIEVFYIKSIDTYVGKLISLFEQLYGLKTIKP